MNPTTDSHVGPPLRDGCRDKVAGRTTLGETRRRESCRDNIMGLNVDLNMGLGPVLLVLFCLLNSFQVCQAQDSPLSESETQALAKAARVIGAGKVEFAEGRLDNAVDLHREAFKMVRDVMGDGKVIAELNHQFAQDLTQAGHAGKAIEFYQSAEKAYLELHGESHISVAVVRSAIANVYDQAGQNQDAESYYRKSLTSFAGLAGGDSPSHAITQFNLAYLYKSQDRIAEAADQLTQVISLCEKNPQWDAMHLAQAHSVYSELLFLQEKRAQGRIELDNARRVCRTGGPSCDQIHATILFKLANLAQIQGNNQQSVDRLRESLEILQRTLDGPNIRVALTHSKLGLQLIRLVQPEEGIKHLRKSLEIGQRSPDGSPSAAAEILRRLSTGAMILGKYEDAHGFAVQEREMCENAFGKNHPLTGEAIYHVGMTAFYLDKNDEAVEHLNDSIKVLRSVDRVDDHVLSGTLFGAAVYFTAMDNIARARDCYDEGIQIVHRRDKAILPSLTLDEQDSYVTLGQRNTNTLWSFALHQQDDPSVIDQSAQWLANRKGIGVETLATQIKIREMSESDDPLAQQLLQLQSQVAANALVPLSSDPSTRDAQEKRTEATKIQYDAATRRLIAERGLAAVDDHWYSIDEIREALPPSSLYVDFHVVRPLATDPKTHASKPEPNRYVAWVMQPSGDVPIRMIDLGVASEIDNQITSVRDQIKDDAGRFKKRRENARRGLPPTIEDASSRERPVTQATNAKLRDLANQILDPILAGTQGVNEILLSPDQNLWLVPWAALPLTDDASELLVERCGIRLFHSARELIVKTNPSSSPIGDSFIFADPNFDLVSAGTDRDQPDDATRSLTARQSRLHASPLKGTAEEAVRVKALVQRCASGKTKLMTQDSANESLVGQVASPEMLVFITHGFFLPAPQSVDSDRAKGLLPGEDQRSIVSNPTDFPINPMLRGGLMLAGCNQAKHRDESSDDGVLLALEVLGLNLQGTQLVLLGACETGTGETKVGEGVAGLAQAFHIAGARHVMSTLWKVDNLATGTLTEQFFKHLAEGEPHHVALRNAQLESLRARRADVGAAHPYYWSGMTITGM